MSEKFDSRDTKIEGYFLFDRSYDSIYRKFVKSGNVMRIT